MSVCTLTQMRESERAKWCGRKRERERERGIGFIIVNGGAI